VLCRQHDGTVSARGDMPRGLALLQACMHALVCFGMCACCGAGLLLNEACSGVASKLAKGGARLASSVFAAVSMALRSAFKGWSIQAWWLVVCSICCETRWLHAADVGCCGYGEAALGCKDKGVIVSVKPRRGGYSFFGVGVYSPW
jgi:hypothetical protein